MGLSGPLIFSFAWLNKTEGPRRFCGLLCEAAPELGFGKYREKTILDVVNEAVDKQTD